MILRSLIGLREIGERTLIFAIFTISCFCILKLHLRYFSPFLPSERTDLYNLGSQGCVWFVDLRAFVVLVVGNYDYRENNRKN